ncbi:hypothetical protein TNCV_4099291 [Trichonephila clavipes]|nr:hypothetical protein TNCV_4099291 [Trichonephila clavipes]
MGSKGGKYSPSPCPRGLMMDIVLNLDREDSALLMSNRKSVGNRRTILHLQVMKTTPQMATSLQITTPRQWVDSDPREI